MLFAALIFVWVLVVLVGLAIFRYGRKQRRMPHFCVGLAMMVFPVLVPHPLILAMTAAALCGALYLMVRLGL
jgi:hypothetical protein